MNETLIPKIFSYKWYNPKTKEYEEGYVKDLKTIIEKANEAFDKGTKYFSINLINIE